MIQDTLCPSLRHGGTLPLPPQAMDSGKPFPVRRLASPASKMVFRSWEPCFFARVLAFNAARVADLVGDRPPAQTVSAAIPPTARPQIFSFGSLTHDSRTRSYFGAVLGGEIRDRKFLTSSLLLFTAWH